MLRMTKEDVRRLWERITRAVVERYSYLTDKEQIPILNPSATDAEIAALERHWGYDLPPSYRLVLSLFNGAKRFAYSTPLLSTHELIEEQYDWDVVDELAPELVPYVFAGDMQSDLFFAFDPRVPTGGGEFEVAIFSTDGSEERHPSIVAFLEAYLGALDAGIARERADREGLK